MLVVSSMYYSGLHILLCEDLYAFMEKGDLRCLRQLCFYSLWARSGFYHLAMYTSILPIATHCLWPAQPLIFTLWLFRKKLANPCLRVVVLKLQRLLESPRGLIKAQIAGPCPQSFWFSRSRMEPEYLLINWVPRCCWSCWSLRILKTHTLTSDIGLGQSGVSMSSV